MADTGLTEFTSEMKILPEAVVFRQMNDENGLKMIKISLMAIMVKIYNMNNGNGTEMNEI